jgi:hypothetical protein
MRFREFEDENMEEREVELHLKTRHHVLTFPQMQFLAINQTIFQVVSSPTLKMSRWVLQLLRSLSIRIGLMGLLN